MALIKQVKGFKNREEAKLIISCIFQIIYSTCNEQNLQIKQNVVDIDIAKKSGKSYADHFFQFIQFNLNYIEVPNLGEEFFFENYLPIGDTKFDSVDYQIEILLKYERFLLRRYDDIYKSYYKCIRSVPGDIGDEVKATVDNSNQFLGIIFIIINYYNCLF